MWRSVRAFLLREEGATTVDWVVLAGACIGLTVAMLSTMNGSTTSVATEIETVLGDVQVTGIATLGYSN